MPSKPIFAMPKYETKDVFTPTKPAKLTFVERDDINEQLVDALRTPGKQVVVYGPTGSGKTTLLQNKLHQIYPDHIVTRCTIATTYENLILAAFDKLNPYYISETQKKHKQVVKAKLAADYLGIKSGIEAQIGTESQDTFSRMLPVRLSAERLAEFVGAAECCWVVEDFHKVPDTEKTKFAQVMKVFMDAASDYDSVKIIAIGAVDTARQVVEYDAEMHNRVAEVAVPLMEEEQIREIIDKGERLLNFSLVKGLKGEIALYASGLGGVCHQICLNICFAANIYETQKQTLRIQRKHLKKAISRYLKDSSDTLKATFDTALKVKRKRTYDNCGLILRALTQFQAEGATHAQILTEIRKKHSSYPASNLTNYLKELRGPERGNIVRYDSYSGRHSFSNPLYRAFALLKFGASTDQLNEIKKKGIYELLFQNLETVLKTEFVSRRSA